MALVSTNQARGVCWKCGRKRYKNELDEIGVFNNAIVYECKSESVSPYFRYVSRACREQPRSYRIRMRAMLSELNKIFERKPRKSPTKKPRA